MYEKILNLLKCPDCGHPDLAPGRSGASIACPSCKRDFDYGEDGVLKMMPLREPKKLPEMYNDPDYLKWMAYLEKSSEGYDYFTNSNALFRKVHESGHLYVERALEGRRGWALDLGCGHGFHYDFMSAARVESTVAMDIGLTALKSVKKKCPSAIVIQSDIYRHPFQPGSFSSVYSIYNLEHLYYLEDALEQVAGLMAADGAFLVSIPCEGGFLWNSGRKLTSERTMSEKLGADYRKIIAIEHCNTARRVIAELKKRFKISGGSYFPLIIPSLNMNLTASFSLARKG